MKNAAHFLLNSSLVYSPPNEAIVHALLENGYNVDLYAPGQDFSTHHYGVRVSGFGGVEYSRKWLARNFSRFFGKYSIYSGTSEDPLGVVGLLAKLYNKPSFVLVDEIKTGIYSGNAPAHWKNLCRWAMRNACFCIVNDQARIQLLADYAELRNLGKIIVYPGAYRDPPPGGDRSQLRANWGFSQKSCILGASGGLNQTNGFEWLIEFLKNNSEFQSVIQPLNMEPLTQYMLNNLTVKDQVYVEKERLSWFESWSTAAAIDIGLAIYLYPAPQFQHMGISSNRLCMFLSMGVPVIASKQKSFDFLYDYDCGRQASTFEEFEQNLHEISENLEQMKFNSLQCAKNYINAKDAYTTLCASIFECVKE